MKAKINLAMIAGAALLATTLGASAQSQTDSNGNAMGSQHVGNGVHKSTGTKHKGTVGSAGMNRTTPPPASSQGDVGPAGNNNGTR
ncbi:putative low-complexity protein [Rhodopseudomonas rhenobacensis]|uniref:Putative low-complexity protein n=1 Tax=Rhodopseudomonas rhenobacensis TaxID=87461 RepID=A0A7W8DXJ5_9BRAD|nr:hypothetical protein [Rhodopseudomonas rhenobacensis]MBB5045815.1 putative low-complexity protein [Rhodopseudomonas rhenobacensis]